MEQKQNNKLKETDSKYQGKGKSSLFIGGIIVFIIASTPFLFYSYNSFPSDSKTWETIFFTFHTEFSSTLHFAWYFVGKFVPLLLLLIWFFTCKHWWHWIILVPIAMYAFQLAGIIQENRGLDELELYYIIPIMMFLVPFVYLIRAKLFDKVRGTDLAKFEEDLAKPMTLWDQFLDLFK